MDTLLIIALIIYGLSVAVSCLPLLWLDMNELNLKLFFCIFFPVFNTFFAIMLVKKLYKKW